MVITAGQRGDSPQFETVLGGIAVPRLGPGRPRTRPDRVLGDKAYSSAANRAYLRRRGIRCTIPEPADQIRNRKNRGRAGRRPPAFARYPATPPPASLTQLRPNWSFGVTDQQLGWQVRPL